MSTHFPRNFRQMSSKFCRILFKIFLKYSLKFTQKSLYFFIILLKLAQVLAKTFYFSRTIFKISFKICKISAKYTLVFPIQLWKLNLKFSTILFPKFLCFFKISLNKISSYLALVVLPQTKVTMTFVFKIFLKCPRTFLEISAKCLQNFAECLLKFSWNIR